MAAYVWREGNGTVAVAHLIVDGVPLCARRHLADGTPMLAPFKCGWVPEREWDKRCGICRRMAPHLERHTNH